VFQQHLLFPHLSVRRNLLYGWKRRSESDRRATLEHIVEILDLGDLLERDPATLSGGQRQRVALGRALLCAPQLLLLDEPLASVDDELKQQMLRYIEQALAEWKIPVLYVTHHPAEVRHLCSAALRLHVGRVIAAGNPDDVLDDSRLPSAVLATQAGNRPQALPSTRREAD
jgi:molybdate transport system ATP-binding protein